MFNPLYPLTNDLLNAFINEGMKFFVRQSYPRGKDSLDEDVKAAFLITHYEKLTEAQNHYDVIKHDPNRFLYEWDNPEHQDKLWIAANAPITFKVFSNTFRPNWEKSLSNNKDIKAAIRAYISRLGWRPTKEHGVSTNCYMTFGELYIQLKHKTQEIKVKFDEIDGNVLRHLF